RHPQRRGTGRRRDGRPIADLRIRGLSPHDTAGRTGPDPRSHAAHRRKTESRGSALGDHPPGAEFAAEAQRSRASVRGDAGMRLLWILFAVWGTAPVYAVDLTGLGSGEQIGGLASYGADSARTWSWDDAWRKSPAFAPVGSPMRSFGYSA